MSRVRKAVITAAGRGTRQYPASSAVQKEMFPLVDRDGLAKPIIQIIGEEAIDAGVEEICIVTQPGDESHYRSYFQRMNDETLKAFKGKAWAIDAGERLHAFGERLTFVSQDSPEGYGHAVYQAREFVGDEPFLLMLGDHIYIAGSGATGNCAAQLIEHHRHSGAKATSAVQATPASSLHLFGAIQGAPIEGHDHRDVEADSAGLYHVKSIYEKPTAEYAASHLRTPGLAHHSYLCHFGMHVFPGAIFDALAHHIDNDIRERGEIQLTSSQEYMRTQLLKENDYAACTIDGQRYDTGIPYGLMESQLALAMAGTHRGEIVEAIARLLASELQSLSKK